jgi:hypothetical protein
VTRKSTLVPSAVGGLRGDHGAGAERQLPSPANWCCRPEAVGDRVQLATAKQPLDTAKLRTVPATGHGSRHRPWDNWPARNGAPMGRILCRVEVRARFCCRWRRLLAFPGSHPEGYRTQSLSKVLRHTERLPINDIEVVGRNQQGPASRDRRHVAFRPGDPIEPTYRADV